MFELTVSDLHISAGGSKQLEYMYLDDLTWKLSATGLLGRSRAVPVFSS